MVNKKAFDEWETLNTDPVPINEPDDESVQDDELRLTISENDPRTGFRISKNCISCKYYWYAQVMFKGWCFYPHPKANYNSNGPAGLQANIEKMAKARGWRRTSAIFLCDKWELIRGSRVLTQITWANLDTLSTGEKSEQ